jgi:flavin-dependent dehydrogenase
VIGGGPAGLATAIELRRRSARAVVGGGPGPGADAGVGVVVAEATDAPAERFGETLPPDILLSMERLGLRDAFRADGHLPCPGSVSLWGHDTPGHNDFILNPLGPAWHISRARFEAMLRTRAVQLGAELRPSTRAVATSRTADGFEVVLRDSSGGCCVVQTAWVVDATGPRAWFARRQGASLRRFDRGLASSPSRRCAKAPSRPRPSSRRRPTGGGTPPGCRAPAW